MNMILISWEGFWKSLGDFFVRLGNSLYTFWINPGDEKMPYIATFIFALIFLVLGYFLIKLINKIIRKILKLGKKKFVNEKSIKNLIASTISAFLYFLLVIGFLAILGANLTGIATIISSGILAVGLSLQDVISNFASGIIILSSKPFVVGDYVSLNNGEAEGTVKEVRFTSTYLENADNNMISVPNKNIVNSVIKNYSKMPYRRVTITISVNYDSDIDNVKNSLLELVLNDDRVDKINNKPSVVLSNLNEYSLDFTLRFYVKQEFYWDFLYEYNELIIKKCRKDNIDIPFKRIDIYDINNKKVDFSKEK